MLAWLEPSQRLFSWSVYSGSVYSRTVSYYVVGMRQDSTALTEVTSIAAVNAAGKWFFDPDTLTLYVRSTGSVDPGTLWTDVTYRLFFANAPIDLPATLVDGGKEVPYDSRLRSTSKFKESFSDDQKGIALEGSGSVALHNTDAYFEAIYDRLVWENKTCKIFSYARDIPLSDKVVLFNGVVTSKDFSAEQVSFGLKNFIYKLRSELDLPLYSEDDGQVPDSLIGKPKRRVYGRVDGLYCGPVDTQGPNYALQTVSGDLRTGTPILVSLTAASNVAVASDATVHLDMCAGDQLKVNGTTFKVKSLSRIDIGLDTPQNVTLQWIDTVTARLNFSGMVTTGVSTGDHVTFSILSNATTETKSKVLGHFVVATVDASWIEFTWPTTVSSMTTDTFKSSTGEIVFTRHTNTTSLTLQTVSAVSVTSLAATVVPSVPYRRFNRRYSVAHHALSTRSTTITGVTSAVKLSVADVDGVYEGDIIRISGANLSTIVGLDRQAKLITVSDVVLPFPSVGDTVERLGIQRVTHSQQEFTQFDDFEPEYDSDLGASVLFDSLAEFNACPTAQLSSRVSWVNGSKQVLGTDNVFAGLKVRDWVRSDTTDTWYEIAEKFSDNLIILNLPYGSTTGSNVTYLKQPLYLSDVSTVIAEVYGRTDDGTESGALLITAANVAQDLLTDAGVSDLVDTVAFDAASEECPYRISLALPLEPTGNSPIIRDALNYVSDSVLGSLYTATDGSIQYRTVDASRTAADAILIDQSDVIDASVETDSSKIYRKVLVRFAGRDADTVTEKPTYSVEQSESDFVTNSGIDGTVLTQQSFLYSRDDAQILAQRIRFMHELASSRVSVLVSLLLVDSALNDLVSISLDRIYPRLGTSGIDRSKTGLISSISRDGLTCEAVIDDLGNIFNRVGTVTGNNEDDWADSDETDRRFNGYITDNDGLEDEDETTFNANLIG